MVKKTIYMKKLVCDLCGKNGRKLFLKNITTWDHSGVFNLVKCTYCNLIYLYPRPDSAQINKYYSKDNYWNWDLNGESVIWRDKNFKILYDLIFNKKNKGKILDIGTGTGIFLTKFEENGWDVVGTELSLFAFKNTSNMYKIDMKEGDFLRLKFEKADFDVITLNHVLEHLYSPRKTLLKVNKKLKSGGLLVITLPNIDSLGFRIFGGNWHALQPPRHLYQFTPITLTKLLENSGFKVGGFIYNYKAHIIYSLFESFRFSLSPKFKKSQKGGLINKDYKWSGFINIIIRELGKVFALCFAYTFYCLEIVFKKSDVITIYATKN